MQVKVRTFSGVVCEQEVYRVSDRVRTPDKAEKRLRFQTEEERIAHREAMARKWHARLFNANFSPSSLYSTLTLDNAHEVHTFQEAKRLRTLFIRRLKYAYPNAVIFAYLGRGKNTDRIHMHMVSNGIPEEAIRAQWIYGEVIRISHLRKHNKYDGVDHGQDYTGLANYLFDHWTPEQGGHRWYQTRNAKKPEQEEPKEAHRKYSLEKPPRTPKGYILVESKGTRYGYFYFKYVKLPDKP